MAAPATRRSPVKVGDPHRNGAHKSQEPRAGNLRKSITFCGDLFKRRPRVAGSKESDQSFLCNFAGAPEQAVWMGWARAHQIWCSARFGGCGLGRKSQRELAHSVGWAHLRRCGKRPSFGVNRLEKIAFPVAGHDSSRYTVLRPKSNLLTRIVRDRNNLCCNPAQPAQPG